MLDESVAIQNLQKLDWFDQYGWFVRTFPDLCVAECSHSGACDNDVRVWQKTLGFDVPRRLAIEYLSDFGAWSESELNQMMNTELSEIVLWIACGDIKESGEWLGLVS
jgi:hypothetical protein